MAFNNKLEKEKQKLITEKCQSILTQLLRDEDNKYCVDCDAKGPRWASWNLGIFLCIRCAGIHRNLGVHISKVKSVNLDAWTPEQIACIQNMGNSKARAVYEANLPDNFRRPQTDSSLEAFVRAKYEQKKYIAKEWVEPPPPKPAFDIEEELRKEKERKKNKKFQNQNPIEVQASPLPRPVSSPVSSGIKTVKNDKIVVKAESSKNSADLLGLDVNSSSDDKLDDDSFGLFVSSVSAAVPLNDNNLDNKIDSKAKSNEESDFFNQKAPTDDKKVLSKESILSLYSTAQPPPPLLNQPQQPVVGPQNSAFNASNQSLFMGPFGATSQPIPGQNQNSFYMSQNTAVSGIQTSIGQTPNLINQSNFPLTTNPFLANTSKSSNFGQQTVPQLSQNMASLQMNPVSAPTVTNSSINPVVSNSWFGSGAQGSGLPVPPAGVVNPFMVSSAPIAAGVPFNTTIGQLGVTSGSLFASSDSGSQWAFGANSLNQTTAGMTASTNLWQ